MERWYSDWSCQVVVLSRRSYFPSLTLLQIFNTMCRCGQYLVKIWTKVSVYFLGHLVHIFSVFLKWNITKISKLCSRLLDVIYRRLLSFRSLTDYWPTTWYCM